MSALQSKIPFTVLEPVTMKFYYLKGKTPVLCMDFFDFAEKFDRIDRTVGKTNVNGIVVSTVFLGMDHGHGRSKKPILFETMTFSGEGLSGTGIADGESLDMSRCSTWDDAVAQHVNMVYKVTVAMDLDIHALIKDQEKQSHLFNNQDPANTQNKGQAETVFSGAEAFVNSLIEEISKR